LSTRISPKSRKLAGRIPNRPAGEGTSKICAGRKGADIPSRLAGEGTSTTGAGRVVKTLVGVLTSAVV